MTSWKRELYKAELEKEKQSAILKRKMKALKEKEKEIERIKAKAKKRADKKYGTTRKQKIKAAGRSLKSGTKKAASKARAARAGAARTAKKWQQSPTMATLLQRIQRKPLLYPPYAS